MLVAQSGPTLCNPMDSSPTGSSVHGILHTGILEWIAILFSRESSQSRDPTRVFRIAGRLYHLSHQGVLVWTSVVGLTVQIRKWLVRTGIQGGW